MAPDTQTIDFNATFTVGLAFALSFDNPFGGSGDAGKSQSFCISIVIC